MMAVAAATSQTNVSAVHERETIGSAKNEEASLCKRFASTNDRCRALTILRLLKIGARVESTDEDGSK